MVQKQFLWSAGDSMVTRNRIALIPAYNDARFIGSVVLQSLRHVERVVVVDDGSSDGSADIARAAGAEVLSMPEKVGKACALSEGIRYVRRLQPTAVVMIGGDGQDDPNQIPNLLEPIEREIADLAIGFIGIERIDNQIPMWRVVGQQALATNLASGVKSGEWQSGIRAFAPQALPFLDFYAKGFSLESQMGLMVRENDLLLVEVPICARSQPPKGNPNRHGRQLLDGVRHVVARMRSFLFFFGALGSLIFIVGLLIGAWVVQIQPSSSELAMEYALVCLLLAIMGGIAFSTGLILHSVRTLLSE
ncbi:MAG: glycosyltransferase family 2 protein [Ardenticatenaceae bacterium]